METAIVIGVGYLVIGFVFAFIGIRLGWLDPVGDPGSQHCDFPEGDKIGVVLFWAPIVIVFVVFGAWWGVFQLFLLPLRLAGRSK